MHIEITSKPARLSKQLDKAVTTNYKPVADHQYNIESERRKKEEGKRARADKQQVLTILFSAFEKHQYYTIKDLVDITKQPVFIPRAHGMCTGDIQAMGIYKRLQLQNYLKDILREICTYNAKGTHKSTWELMPEYRHYQKEEKSE